MTTNDTSTGTPKRTRRLRRVLAWTGIGAAGLVVLVVVALLLPPVRGALLREALVRADAALPGTLAVERATWPAPGTIELEGLRWTDAGDTLARAAHLRVEAALWPLVRRDVVVHRIELTGAAADVPAIAAQFPPGPDTTAVDTTGSGASFPREGSVEGLPSVAIANVVLAIDSIRVGENDVLAGIDVEAGADMRRGHKPSAHIDRLNVTGRARAWGIDSMTVAIDLDLGVVDGKVRGRAGRHRPFFVVLSSPRADRFTVTVTRNEGEAPPRDAGLQLALVVRRTGLDIEGADIDAVIRIPDVDELAADPALAPALASAPPLEGVVVRVDAAVEMAPVLDVDGTVTIEENTWLRGAHIAGSYTDGVAEVTRATVSLDGLELRADARVGPDSLRAAASIDVTGGSWLETLSPGTAAPRPLAGTVNLSARAAMPATRLAVRVDAGATVGTTRIDTLRVDSDIATGAGATSRIAVVAAAMGYYAGLQAEVDRSQDIAARLSPLLIRSTRISRAPAMPRRPGSVRVSETGAIAAREVRITGDLGEVTLNADLDASGEGRVRAGARWPSLPAPLAARAGGGALVDSLRGLWSQHGPFAVNATADITNNDIRADVSVDLPGPRTLAPLLGAGADVGDLDNLRGTLAARIGRGPDSPIDVTADLGATAWIDTARVQARIRDGVTTVDTLALSVEAIGIHGAGVVSSDVLDLKTRLRVDDVAFIRRFAPGVPALRVAFDGTVTGAAADPVIAADLDATVAGTAVAGRARVGGGEADIRLHAPDGVALPNARFTTAEITVSNRTAGAGLFPAAVTINLSGDGIGFYHAATVDTTGGIVVAADTLGLVIAGRDLRSRHAFRVHVGPEPGYVSIDNLDLAGSLGTVTLDAALGADSAVATADIAVDMPDKPASLALPENYWPESARLRLRARADGRIDADMHVGGITLADGREPDIDAGIESTGRDIDILVAVSDDDSVLLDAKGRIPAAVSLVPFSVRTGDGAASIVVHAREVPLALRMDDSDDRRVIHVSGDARIAGTTSAPAGTLSAVVAFPGWPKLEGYRISFDAAVNAGTGDDAVDARLRVLHQDAERLTASLRYSGALSLTPPILPDDGSGRIEVRARSQTLALGEFDALLPSDVGMSGTLGLSLDADGPVRNPSLNGELEAKNVEVTVRQRMRLLSNGTVTLRGDLAEPVARGDVVIESGLIQIPDPPRQLHPVEGTAMLVEQRSSAADTTAATTESEPAPLRGDIDVTVTIPGGLWIRGQGLEVELAGDLRIRQEGARPTLTGQLRAQRGNLVLLGRSFELERGTVVFYGDDEANPSLDVQLSTAIDGVTVTVSITGTAAEPELNLRSNPEMEEGDIMSYLVFGRPLDNLDQDQRGLVETRATEIAAAMGAARLQDELREQLGVDMVTIRSATADEEASALVVGKYLNPRLLIKYERLLEEQAAQFINIEYFLTRRLKVETLYGRHDQQGIEIEWSNEY